jgi:hypothetical protein
VDSFIKENNIPDFGWNYEYTNYFNLTIEEIKVKNEKKLFDDFKYKDQYKYRNGGSCRECFEACKKYLNSQVITVNNDNINSIKKIYDELLPYNNGFYMTIKLKTIYILKGSKFKQHPTDSIQYNIKIYDTEFPQKTWISSSGYGKYYTWYDINQPIFAGNISFNNFPSNIFIEITEDEWGTSDQSHYFSFSDANPDNLKKNQKVKDSNSNIELSFEVK